jgi:hypothetical protein
VVHDGALVGIPDEPDVNLPTATVSPCPMPLNKPVSVVVSAIDINSGTALCRAQEPLLV